MKGAINEGLNEVRTTRKQKKSQRNSKIRKFNVWVSNEGKYL